MFDTDAESFGDTTMQSLGSSEARDQVQLQNGPIVESRHHFSQMTPVPEQDRTPNVTNNQSTAESEVKREDNGSSIYPEEYEDGYSSEEAGEGDRLEVAQLGFPFLKPGETQEWSQFQQTSLSQLPIDLGPDPRLEATNLPQRISSASHRNGQLAPLRIQKQRPAAQAQRKNSTFKSASPLILSIGLVITREQTPQRTSYDASIKNVATPLAVRDKPLPKAPETTTEAPLREPPKKTPFPLQSLPKSQAVFEDSRDTSEENTPSALSQHRFASSSPTKMIGGRGGLDYTPRQLSKMSYSDLAKESFDFIPGPLEKFLSEDIVSKSLEGKLEYLMHLGDWTNEAKASLRAKVFANVSLNDFERCGQWLSRNIEASVASQSTIRRRKRTAAQAFEGELTNRMELIKKHKGHVDDSLKRLKVAGSNMVAGKFTQNATISATTGQKVSGKRTTGKGGTDKKEAGESKPGKKRSQH